MRFGIDEYFRKRQCGCEIGFGGGLGLIFWSVT